MRCLIQTARNPGSQGLLVNEVACVLRARAFGYNRREPKVDS